MIFDKAWNFDGFGVSMSVNPCKQNPWFFVLFYFCFETGKDFNEWRTNFCLLWSFAKSQDLSVRGPINLQQNRQMSFAKSPFLLLKSIEIPIFAKLSCLLVLKSGRICSLLLHGSVLATCGLTRTRMKGRRKSQWPHKSPGWVINHLRCVGCTSHLIQAYAAYFTHYLSVFPW